MTYPAAFGTESTYAPDGLVRLGFPIKDKKFTLLSGQNDLLRGMVLGKATMGAATAAPKSGGNGSADGTFVIDATTPTLAGAIPGIYTLRVIELHAAHDYTWELNDPNGKSLGSFRLTGTGAAITIAEQIKGALTDGATDWVVGHGFDITVPAGTGKVKKAVATAVDGSQYPIGVLIEDADAGAGDVECMVRIRGGFNLEKLIHDESFTDATLEVALELNPGIVVESIAVGA